MSIDFMVFDPSVAPRSPRAFRAWYFDQIRWEGGYDHLDPSVATPAIRDWYNGMTERFPNANLDQVKPDKVDASFGDYNFCHHLCYVAFRPPVADEAWWLTRSLADQHRLGTYDPNSDDERNNDCIRFPDGPLNPDPPSSGGVFSFLRRK